jgi:CMP-N,N'-diacetyllegionaminic acid synthase
VLFTICGRAGSKGLKGKSIKHFLEIPIVYYSISAIVLYKNNYPEDRYYFVLNTDSAELIRIVNLQSEIEFFTIVRDETLSDDNVPKVSVIKDCLLKSEDHFNLDFDMVIDLDITSPLRSISDIKKAVEKKKLRNDIDVVYSVTDARRHPYFNMVTEKDNFSVKVIPSMYTARQQLPEMFDMNGSIYVYSPNALKSKPSNVFFNDNCASVHVLDTGVLDIDSEQDYELMQVIAPYFFKNHSGYKDIYALAEKISIYSYNVSDTL